MWCHFGNALIIMLPHRLTPRTPPGNPQESRGSGTIFKFLFFGPRGSNVLVLEMTLSDHRVIPLKMLRQCDRQGESCIAWSKCENEQKACNKIGYICLLFLPMKGK